MLIIKKRPYLKKIAALIVLLFIFGFIPGCSSNATKNETYQNIDAKEAFDLIQNKELLILDVRTPGEYAAGHIKNSVLIPLQVLETDYTKILDYRGKSVFLYCRSGNRSVGASKILIKNGFKKLYNLKSGINDWVKNGFPLER